MKSFVLLAAISLPLSAAAQQPAPAKHPMTFADLAAIKRISDPEVSPSGKWVLFSVTDVALAQNSKSNHLWVVPMNASGKPDSPKARQLTEGSGESGGRFSPNGETILYTADDRGKGQVFVADWNDAKGALGKARPATSLATEADGAIWAPDSRHILFTSAVYPECESHAPAGAGRNSAEAACNAEKLAAEEKNPVKAQTFDHLLYRHWNAYTGSRHSHIFYASIDGAAPTDLTPASVIGDHEAPTFSLGGPTGYAISPEGREVAYVVNRDRVPAESTNNDIYTLQLGSDPSTARKVSTSPGSDDGPQYSPDGKFLAWRSQARNGYESDKFDLVVMDRAAGTTRNLTAKFDGWVDEFSWVDDSRHLLFASNHYGTTPLFETNVTGDDLKAYTRGGGEWSEFRGLTLGGTLRIVGVRMWVDHPAAIFNIAASQLQEPWDPARRAPSLGMTPSPETPDSLQLTHINGSVLHAMDTSPAESFWFAGANNTRVQGFIIRPPNFDPDRKYPLKFLMHGGPQGAWGDAWSYRWNPELLAANGYVVVMVNPRGSTGYGQKFLEQVSGDWGGRAYTDLMHGLDYAEAHFPFIDKTRECALGASYGGFMANWVLTHTDRFRCIVTHDGMFNPQSAFGSTEELWFNEWEFRPLASAAPDAVVSAKPVHPWDYFDKPASEDPFRKTSPMLHIKNAHTPTLVVHGQRDYRLDVSEGFQLFTALQLLGVPSKMLYFPDEGHWVLKPRNSELWYNTVNDWCDRWTGTNAYAARGPESNPAATGTPHATTPAPHHATTPASRSPRHHVQADDAPDPPVMNRGDRN